MKFNEISQHLTKFLAKNYALVQFCYLSLSLLMISKVFCKISVSFLDYFKFWKFQTWRWRKMKKSVSKLPTLNKQKITLAYFGAKLAMEKKGS
jgi:hypothetical protein